MRIEIINMHVDITNARVEITDTRTWSTLRIRSRREILEVLESRQPGILDLSKK